MAGAIYASWVNYIEPPDVFDVLLAVKPMVMVLLGGLGTIFGPVIGAVVLLTFEELVWRNFLTIHAAALGVIIVVLVLFLPNGLLSLVRDWRLSAQGAATDGAARPSGRLAAVRRTERGQRCQLRRRQGRDRRPDRTRTAPARRR